LTEDNFARVIAGDNFDSMEMRVSRRIDAAKRRKQKLDRFRSEFGASARLGPSGAPPRREL
jgi:hypothetical protein